MGEYTHTHQSSASHIGSSSSSITWELSEMQIFVAPQLRPTNLEPLGEESSNLYVF